MRSNYIQLQIFSKLLSGRIVIIQSKREVAPIVVKNNICFLLKHEKDCTSCQWPQHHMDQISKEYDPLLCELSLSFVQRGCETYCMMIHGNKELIGIRVAIKEEQLCLAWSQCRWRWSCDVWFNMCSSWLRREFWCRSRCWFWSQLSGGTRCRFRSRARCWFGSGFRVGFWVDLGGSRVGVGAFVSQTSVYMQPEFDPPILPPLIPPVIPHLILH